MSFLLDTNMVSEWVKTHPNPGVVRWLEEVDEDEVFLSVVTLAEVRYGIDRMPHGKRRQLLEQWLEQELAIRFEGRWLGISPVVADRCGRLLARSAAAGRQLEVMDAFLAATAEEHGLALVTRNVTHFERVVSSVVNPWT